MMMFCYVVSVIRRAPHEFKISCLEVCFCFSDKKCTLREGKISEETTMMILFLLRQSKHYFQLIATHSMPDLEIEILMR